MPKVKRFKADMLKMYPKDRVQESSGSSSDESLSSLNWLTNSSINNAGPPGCPSSQQQLFLNSIGTNSNSIPAAGDTTTPGMSQSLGSPVTSGSDSTAGPLCSIYSRVLMQPIPPVEQDYKTNPKAKPLYSLASLIGMALQASKQSKATLSSIYKWIKDNFCYYRQAELRWQNSIRHTLSLNKCFKNVPRQKGVYGKGGFWQIDPEYSHMFVNGIFRRKKQRPDRYRTLLRNRLFQGCRDTASTSTNDGLSPEQKSPSSTDIRRTTKSTETTLENDVDITTWLDDDLGGNCSSMEDMDPTTYEGKTTWLVKLFLLPGPEMEVLPGTFALNDIDKLGLGKPEQESMKSKINLNWSLSELNNFVCQSYPHVSLNVIGFDLARTSKGQKIKKLQVSSVKELKASLGKSRLYIVPRAPVIQITTPNTTPQSSFQQLSTAGEEDETSEANVLSDQTLQEWRAIWAQQDQNYKEILLNQEEMPIVKEEKELAHPGCEENRQKEILSDEENDGPPTLHRSSPGQPSLSETSTQPSLTETSTQSSLPETSTQPSLSGPLYTNPWLSVSPVQPLQHKTSTQLPSMLFSTEPPLPVTTSPPPAIVISDDEGSLTASFVSEPVPILDEEEERVSWNSSPVSQDHLSEPVEEVDLQTVLRKLASRVNVNFCPVSNQINVCRENVFQCSLRAFRRNNFDPEAKLKIVFVDEEQNVEGAVDESGATSEYLRLLMRDIHQSNIFQGPEKNRQLCLDTEALETQLYTTVAQMIAISVVHGVGPLFFSERLFLQICGIPTPTTIDEVGDHTFREQLIKIDKAVTVQEVNSAITEASDGLNIIGAFKHVSSLEQKETLVQSAIDSFVNERMEPALDQFIDGFRTFGLLKELRKNPAVFYDMFLNEPLQTKDLFTLFEVDFSEKGSDRRVRENMTICFWWDWLIDIKEAECSPVSIENILEFISGASSVPPLGFPHRPKIQFLHEGNKIFPEANTGLFILRLPIHDCYESFMKCMTEGIQKSPYFEYK